MKKKCPKCKGTGRIQTNHIAITGPCPKCNGIGKIEKKQNGIQKNLL
jgi:uncharacterized phage protein